MDRIQLKTWLEEGLSLDQIGAIVGRDPSTVGYWLRKYGLTANGRAKHAPKGGIRRQDLEPLVAAGETLVAIAEKLGVSTSTVRYWIARYELPRPHRVRRSEVEKAIAEGRRTVWRDCGKHGWTIFVIENSGRARCRQCRMDRVAEWRRRAKARLVEEAGGECALCGFSESQVALQFHHLDPATKRFNLSLRGVTRSMTKLRDEASKCVLLCGNCHAQVEAGVKQI